MEVNLELKCLQTLKTERLKLTVFDWDNMCVKDLKVAFQNEIEVPACDQKLTYQGRTLSDDLFPLRKLYFRDRDWIVVEFLAKANLAEMRDLLEDLKKFSETIVRQDQNQLLLVSPKKLKESATWYVNHDLVIHALGNLSFSYFIPWKDPKSQVHRHFFVQEGGFSAFMEVLKFASKRYRMEDKSSSRFKFGKGKDVDELARHLRDLNDEQMVLQMHCLSLLWNFSETAHDRRLVLQKGGLQHVIMALLLDPNHYSPAADEFWEVASINETAVGCLVQYAEFADCQEIIASNSETVNKLLCMVECHLCFPIQEIVLSETYSKYSTQIAANTLFCCACSLQTPLILAQSSMLHRMITLTSHLLEGNCDLALRYYCTLFLARIRSSPLVRQDGLSAAEIDKLITCFLGKHKPLDVATWEEKHNYVWVSLVPFVSLAFTGTLYSKDGSIFVQQQDSSFKEVETSSEHTDGLSSCGFNFLIDKALNKCNTMATGYAFNSGKSKVNFDSSELEQTSILKLVGVDDSVQKARESLPHCTTSKLLGSEQTHKLGLFTLEHMLLSSENRKLLVSEKLLPYLECLCWHLGPENGKWLRSQLHKHWSQAPPPLTIICKSVLAFISGFEVVLKI